MTDKNELLKVLKYPIQILIVGVLLVIMYEIGTYVFSPIALGALSVVLILTMLASVIVIVSQDI